MCIVSKIPLERHTAETDIAVYKVFRVHGDGKLSSPVMSAEYETGKLYTTVLPELQHHPVVYNGCKTVRDEYYGTAEGFYSYNRLYDANRSVHVIGSKAWKIAWCICKCTVPKGSEYYTDGFETVSNKLEIGEIIKQG